MKLKKLSIITLSLVLASTLFVSCNKDDEQKEDQKVAISTEFSDLVLITKKNIPEDWNLVEQFVIPHRDLEDFKLTLGDGIKEILNQHFEVGEKKEILRVNYIYTTNNDAAVYAMNALKEDELAQRFVKNDTVVEIISFNKDLIAQAKDLLKL